MRPARLHAQQEHGPDRARAQAAGLVGAAAVYYYYAMVKSPRQRQRRLTDIYKVCARGRVSGSWACKRGEHRASSLPP